LRATASAAVNVSVGTLPLGGVVTAKSLLQASGETCVVQPASNVDNVAKFAIVGVCVLLNGP
jgi:hypothetical protein